MREVGATLLKLYLSECECRINIAGAAPDAKLRNINAADIGFAAVDPGLGALQQLSEIALGKSGILAKALQKRGDLPVNLPVLSLCRHSRRILRSFLLDTNCVSANNG